MPKRKAEARHEEMSDEELDETREDVKNKNTKKSNKAAHKLMIEYLQERWASEVENDFDYWNYSPSTLDKIFCKMWFGVRRTNRDRYTINSLRNLRYGINRNLKKMGAEYDITKSNMFTRSQGAFEDACRLLKKLGYGNVKHYDEITPSGIY